MKGPGTTRIRLDDKLVNRFWSKTDKRGPDECWPFLGSTRLQSGHGQITVKLEPDGRHSMSAAHRISLLVHGVDIYIEG